ncbi:Nif3-like dinuclear metal center hexameric protein [Lentimicrobium sp.]
MTKIKEVLNYIEHLAPLSRQESYDNSGLQAGDPEAEVSGILIALDLTEEVIQDAVEQGANLIITHHPLIFKPLKNITTHTMPGRCLLKAMRHGIALYAAHTNLDNVMGGVNSMIGQKLGLHDLQILQPVSGILQKLVVFVPHAHADKVREALFVAGAGQIGLYDSCSYNLEGSGTFRPLPGTRPFTGETGKLHFEPETRIETICETRLLSRIVEAMIQAHPYEEVAWDAYPLSNKFTGAGSGMMGRLENPLPEIDFLTRVKQTFNAGCVKYSPLKNEAVKRVAWCGGSGSFLIPDAIAAKADVFITGEIKYHDYFLAEGKIVLIEAGHYETEQYTSQLLYQIIKEKFTNFATRISRICTNPINYL